MGSTFAMTGFLLLTDLVNGNNILTIFIALVVVFFLLGLLLGLNIGSRNKDTKKEKNQITPSDLKNPKQTNALVQDTRENSTGQSYRPGQRRTHSRHRHHKHNSVYTL